MLLWRNRCETAANELVPASLSRSISASPQRRTTRTRSRFYGQSATNRRGAIRSPWTEKGGICRLILRSLAPSHAQAFLFAYSLRDKTHAARHLTDDVPADAKQRRLEEVISAFHIGAKQRAAEEAGRVHLVLVEGPSRRSPEHLTGRTCTNRRVVFADTPVPCDWVRAVSATPLSADAAARAEDGSKVEAEGEGAEAQGRVLLDVLGLQPLVWLNPGDYVAVRPDGSSCFPLDASPPHSLCIVYLLRCFCAACAALMVSAKLHR